MMMVKHCPISRRGARSVRVLRTGCGIGMAIALMAGLLLPALAQAQGVSAQALAIFEQKCAECHSPRAKKIKKFGYVNDLAQLAADQKLIAPGNPEKSLLWKSIDKGEMPPDDSDVPPLSAAEKSIVKQWIVSLGTGAGATTIPTTAPATQIASAARAPRSFFKRLIQWKGKFHPLAAHLPIALIMGAMIAEGLYLKSRNSWLTGAVRFCVGLGALGAIVTMGLGWLRAIGYFTLEADVLETHRWLGTFAAGWAIVLALLCERGIRAADRKAQPWQGGSRLLFRLALVIAMVSIGLSAHMGGTLVYGTHYFKF